MIEAVRLGLERAVAAEPDYAEAHACLSLVYCNAFRFRHPIGGPCARPARARAVARRPRRGACAQFELGLLCARARALVLGQFRRRSRRAGDRPGAEPQ